MTYKNNSFYVYIMASNTWTLYTWMTNNLERRISEHKLWIIKWFTKKYNCNKLVYYEESNDVNWVIKREKQIKHLTRKEKEELIKNINPNWMDLSKNWN
ncbi:MAG: hypothetical protein ACD_49C00060G0053 [uncultured bacterium (gcode 4)]|uniref:GIY-YIG domain-containing protein n=1 Tax=uncultured bacterium (gcode 4) TaxID=1234023 RepID=K2AWZ9_9BACT|nr:MAG: hypothetical protein ACD_49C00060G0053 [uncultured bacterium (gcode 4)]